MITIILIYTSQDSHLSSRLLYPVASLTAPSGSLKGILHYVQKAISDFNPQD